MNKSVDGFSEPSQRAHSPCNCLKKSTANFKIFFFSFFFIGKPFVHMRLCKVSGAFMVEKKKEISHGLIIIPTMKPPLSITKLNSMQMLTSSHLFCFFFILCILTSFSLTDGIQLIIVNNCKESIWPGILGTSGHETPYEGGFHLSTGEQTVLEVPEKWSGRVWPRQGCCFDETTGKGSCQTGDCSGLLQCKGIGGIPPATVVEMTLGTLESPLHYYDVSLVDGFNVPVSMIPIGGGLGCGVAACEADLNVCCPTNLVVKRGGRVVACKSACVAAKSDRYCCTGEFASPNSCKPTIFSHLFKEICPRAYSYAYDDSTGLKTCRAPRYVITFCPPN